jgi:hypothetical protein
MRTARLRFITGLLLACGHGSLGKPRKPRVSASAAKPRAEDDTPLMPAWTPSSGLPEPISHYLARRGFPPECARSSGNGAPRVARTLSASSRMAAGRARFNPEVAADALGGDHSLSSSSRTSSSTSSSTIAGARPAPLNPNFANGSAACALVSAWPALPSPAGAGLLFIALGTYFDEGPAALARQTQRETWLRWSLDLALEDAMLASGAATSAASGAAFSHDSTHDSAHDSAQASESGAGAGTGTVGGAGSAGVALGGIQPPSSAVALHGGVAHRFFLHSDGAAARGVTKTEADVVLIPPDRFARMLREREGEKVPRLDGSFVQMRKVRRWRPICVQANATFPLFGTRVVFVCTGLRCARASATRGYRGTTAGRATR